MIHLRAIEHTNCSLCRYKRANFASSGWVLTINIATIRAVYAPYVSNYSGNAIARGTNPYPRESEEKYLDNHVRHVTFYGRRESTYLVPGSIIPGQMCECRPLDTFKI